MLNKYSYTIREVDSNIGGAIVGSNGGTIKTISKQNNSNIILMKNAKNKLDINISSDSLVNILHTVIAIKKIVETISNRRIKYPNVYKKIIKNIDKEFYGFLVGKHGSFARWIKSNEAKDMENNSIKLIGYRVLYTDDNIESNNLEIRLIAESKHNLKRATKYIYGRLNSIKC